MIYFESLASVKIFFDKMLQNLKKTRSLELSVKLLYFHRHLIYLTGTAQQKAYHDFKGHCHYGDFGITVGAHRETLFKP